MARCSTLAPVSSMLSFAARYNSSKRLCRSAGDSLANTCPSSTAGGGRRHRRPSWGAAEHGRPLKQVLEFREVRHIELDGLQGVPEVDQAIAERQIEEPGLPCLHTPRWSRRRAIGPRFRAICQRHTLKTCPRGWSLEPESHRASLTRRDSPSAFAERKRVYPSLAAGRNINHTKGTNRAGFSSRLDAETTDAANEETCAVRSVASTGMISPS